MRDYIKLWNCYIKYFEPLKDDEIGRLIRAMLQYECVGTLPELSGNEQYIWPVVKLDMDVDAVSYDVEENADEE